MDKQKEIQGLPPLPWPEGKDIFLVIPKEDKEDEAILRNLGSPDELAGSIPDINLVKNYMLFPIGSRLIFPSKSYSYIVDDKGYRWKKDDTREN